MDFCPTTRRQARERDAFASNDGSNSCRAAAHPKGVLGIVRRLDFGDLAVVRVINASEKAPESTIPCLRCALRTRSACVSTRSALEIASLCLESPNEAHCTVFWFFLHPHSAWQKSHGRYPSLLYTVLQPQSGRRGFSASATDVAVFWAGQHRPTFCCCRHA
jgi:hypothetical protein